MQQISAGVTTQFELILNLSPKAYRCVNILSASKVKPSCPRRFQCDARPARQALIRWSSISLALTSVEAFSPSSLSDSYAVDVGTR